MCLTVASGRDTIAYSSGPSFPVPPDYAARSIDLNEDGTPDFSFWSPSGPLCTFDIPSSFCTWPYYVGAAGTNQVLITGYEALLQSFGAEIGSNAPPGAAWATPWFGAGLAAYWWSSDGETIDGQLVYGGWSGSLGELGIAYLGVCFYADDGAHYGWVRVRLPSPDAVLGGNLFEFAPVVVDWACETRPDKPIRTGDIDSASGSIQFTVEWSSPHRRLRRLDQDLGTGSFLLAGTTLRGELGLADQFSSAQVIGPDDHHKGTTPLLDFGHPLVAKASHTAFFHEATLTHSQVIRLLHGDYCVTVDNGALSGRIQPDLTVHDARDLFRQYRPTR